MKPLFEYRPPRPQAKTGKKLIAQDVIETVVMGGFKPKTDRKEYLRLKAIERRARQKAAKAKSP